MIMQQAAVLHPDTHGYSAPSPGLRRPRNTASAHGPTCTPAAARRAGGRNTVTLKQTQEKRKGMRPGLTLHYGARLPLSLSPRSLSFSPSLVSLLSAGWIPAVLPAQTLPHGPPPIRRGPFEGRPTSTNLISIAWLGPGAAERRCHLLKRQLAHFPRSVRPRPFTWPSALASLSRDPNGLPTPVPTPQPCGNIVHLRYLSSGQRGRSSQGETGPIL